LIKFSFNWYDTYWCIRYWKFMFITSIICKYAVDETKRSRALYTKRLCKCHQMPANGEKPLNSLNGVIWRSLYCVQIYRPRTWLACYSSSKIEHTCHFTAVGGDALRPALYKNTLKKEVTFKKLHISVFIFGLGYISTWFWFWLVPAQHWFQQV